MRNTLITLLFVLTCFVAQAQLIWTEPVFPRADDAVTVYFDASEGTAGLEDCNCDVYVHAGVITNQSSGSSDWKYVQTSWGQANDDWKMTPVSGQPNVYSWTISPSIQDYYGVPGGEEIEQLAFVFRNADGTITGKGAGESDIFYNVYPESIPFTTLLLAPTNTLVLKQVGEDLTISAAASEEATFSLFQDGMPIDNGIGEGYEYTIDITETGGHEVLLEISNGSQTDTYDFTYAVPTDNVIAAVPAGVEHGITFNADETEVTLVLYAPNKEYIYVVGDFTDWQLNGDLQMNLAPDGATWWTTVTGLVPGETYTFQYLVDGNLFIADPYSELVLDPWNDPYIPEVTYPNLPAYPDDGVGIVTAIQPGAEEYDWQVNDFVTPEKGKYNIYEVLPRDFIHRHDYETLIDTLDYFQNLGINVIELMPINEFEGNESWGYNPSFHMALDKYYGTKNEFKRFIDECHARGIAVFVDVVYNHAFSQSPLAQLYWDGGKPTAESPWFNVDATHDFNVGNDFNHESAATKLFVKKVMAHWINEFRIDGFRFDLTKGFTQNVNGPFNAGPYDASRIAILKEYADECWANDPDFIVILEHFAANDEETELIEYGMLTWGNMNHNYNEGTMGYTGNNLLGTSYKSRGWNTPALVSYMESHDEERLMYKNGQFGNAGTNYDTKEEEIGLRRNEMAAVVYFGIPGNKMLWQFGEVGYDVSINFNCRVCNKPIKWEYFEDANRKRLYNVYSNMMYLRNNYEVFHTDDFIAQVGGGAQTFGKTVQLNGTDMNVNIVSNFNVEAQNVTANFQNTGTWYDYFTGESIEVTNVGDPLFMTPGEYRVYTDEPLNEPIGGYITVTRTEEVLGNHFNLTVFPNPTIETFNLTYELKPKGQYLVKMTVGSQVEVRTLVVQ